MFRTRRNTSNSVVDSVPWANRFRPHAFTLVEVLVVVGIIMVLIVILSPALSNAREAGRCLCCQTHLRQWSAAANLYASEWNGWLPRRGQGIRPVRLIDRPEDWFNALPPVLRMEPFVDLLRDGRAPRPGEHSLWTCPSAVDVGHEHFFAYAMNMMLSTWWADKPDRIDRVGEPSKLAFMTDGTGMHCAVVPSYEDYSPQARHRGMVNITFLDGHVASFRASYVGCGLGDPRHNDIRWVVPGSCWPEPGQP